MGRAGKDAEERARPQSQQLLKMNENKKRKPVTSYIK